MKNFALTRYHFYRPEFKTPLKLGLLSDVHFSKYVTTTQLSAIANFYRAEHPDYLLLPGDLIDSNDELDDPAAQQRLLDWLAELGQIAPLFVSLGNHDLYRKSTKAQRQATGQVWQIEYNTPFFCQVAALDGVTLLNNRVHEDDRLFLLGLTNSPSYYNFLEKSVDSSPFHHIIERPDLMLEEITTLPADYREHLPAHKLKLALIHSPIHLSDPPIAAALREFDYLISGHMHQGLVPPVVDELWRSDKGFFSPTREFFPARLRNTIKTNADRSVVAGAVTTFVGPLHRLNAFYPTHLATLTFSAAEQYQRKPYVRHQYLNW